MAGWIEAACMPHCTAAKPSALRSACKADPAAHHCDCIRPRICVVADPTSTSSRLTISPVDAHHLDRDEAVEVRRHPHLPRAALPQLAVQGLAYVLPPDLRHRGAGLRVHGDLMMVGVLASDAVVRQPSRWAEV